MYAGEAMRVITVFCYSLLCLLQARPSSSSFVFELELSFVNATDDCDIDETDPSLTPCEPFLSIFCLREGSAAQSSSTESGDCPLGRNDSGIFGFTTTDRNNDSVTRPALQLDPPQTRKIMSDKPWPVRYMLWYLEIARL